MTRGFWKDRQRYIDSYWSRIPGLWLHGDFAAIDADGLWYLLGRSDDTIKVAGKRLGPAEVEAILNAHDSVAESAAIGVPHEVKGQEVVAFVVLAPGVQASEDSARGTHAIGHRGAGQTPQAQGHPLRRRPAQDPQRQGHAPHHPRRPFGGCVGGCEQFGGCGDGGGDCGGQLTLVEPKRSLVYTERQIILCEPGLYDGGRGNP